MIETIKEAVEFLGKNADPGDPGEPFFIDRRYIPQLFDEANFTAFMARKGKMKIAFVDSGSMEIFKAPNFSVGMCRIYSNLFSGLKKRKQKIPSRIEFFSISTARVENKGIVFDTKLIPLRKEYQTFLPDENDLTFNALDPTVSTSTQMASIYDMHSHVCRLAEWKACSELINKMSPGDVLVKDGALQVLITNENKYANMAQESAQRNGVVLSAFGKTCGLLTTSGSSLIGAIKTFSKNFKKIWYYNPVARSTHPNHKAEIYFLRLHRKSNYIFRYEILKDQNDAMDEKQKMEIMEALAFNAGTAGFLGYPYGLMDAVANSRVKEEEINNLRILFLSEMKKQKVYDKMIPHIRAREAKEILNVF